MVHPIDYSGIRADYLLQRFPKHRRRVLERIERDQEIAEMNDEYNEVCAALEEMEAEEQGATSTTAELRRLRKDLKAELAEALAILDRVP